MKTLLGDEYDAFLKSYEEEKSYGLRLNTLKIAKDDFIANTPFALRQIPWVENGFFYDEAERPGKHPYHEAGLYYIQDPSAMAVVELMNPQPSEVILDMSAAPGGKATQIAAQMAGEGLLVANEIHPNRARILSQNVERMGIKNAVVTNERPENLSARFPAYFDRILVDAPCSGEGMFRKNEEATAEWSIENVAMCASRQIDILKEAHKMLRKGGQLVYSTCTFSPEENEQIVAKFVKEHPEYSIEQVEIYEGFDRGRSDWTSEPVQYLDQTVRIWPHRVEGEGHFIALLRKEGGEERPRLRTVKAHKHTRDLQYFHKFAKETLTNIPNGLFHFFGDQLYIVPEEMIVMKNMRVLRAGWHVGTNKRNRFEPSHALALSLRPDEVKFSHDIAKESEEVITYLKGETLQVDGPKGWYLITVDGYSLGWGKLSNNIMKNHYPRGLRWMGV